MSRRAPIVVVALAAVLLAMAAAAQPVRLWVVPNLSGPSSSDDPAGGAPAPPPQELKEPVQEPVQGAALAKVLAAVVCIGALVALIATHGLWTRRWPRLRIRLRSRETFSPLPDIAETDLAIDIAAARAALSTGRPRSAIVACWMQLESDIAAVGWPRADAETSAEYVQRVVAEVSVDRGSISELAELYREARFSDHELRDVDRTRAFEALSRVEAGLRSNSSVSA